MSQLWKLCLKCRDSATKHFLRENTHVLFTSMETRDSIVEDAPVDKGDYCI